jgi:two-component system, cell cycle sensor histidine kinase and response regulator CckA
MDEATKARVFEPFFTTKGPGKGTGLGLATVYGIVQQHKGWIELASEAGRGASFSIFLPAVDGTVVSSGTPRSCESPVRGGGETILLVEDEAVLRALACATLTGLGYKVIEAENALAALAVWKQRGREVDLLLSDLMMPGGLGGRELAEQLRRDRPTLKVLYCSGYGPEVSAVCTAAEKTTRYLQKPYRPEMLARTVRECLDPVVA